jgi:hypothetical protein
VKMIGNELFAFYGLTRFLLLYLLREVLETDVEGKKFCLKPSTFIKQPRGKSRVLECTDTIAQVVVRLLDAEIKRRDAEPTAPFDFKRELKSPNPVRELRSTVVAHYQIAVDSKLAPTFSGEWQKTQAKT